MNKTNVKHVSANTCLTPVPIPNTEVKPFVPKILIGYPIGRIGFACQNFIRKGFTNAKI